MIFNMKLRKYFRRHWATPPRAGYINRHWSPANETKMYLQLLGNDEWRGCTVGRIGKCTIIFQNKLKAAVNAIASFNNT